MNSSVSSVLIPAAPIPRPLPNREDSTETTGTTNTTATTVVTSTTEITNPDTDIVETPSSPSKNACAPAVTADEVDPPSISISAASATGSASIRSPTSSSRSNYTKDDSAAGNHTHFSPRVVYGAGTVQRLPTELGRLLLTAPLIVSSPSRIPLARRIQSLIPNLDSRILDSALVNVPQRVVDDAISRITGRDCVISVGGTSAVGLAKTIAARKEIPHICIPTTYSGSEMPTPADTRRRQKSDNRHRSLSGSASSVSSVSRKTYSKSLPSIIIYDEDLTATVSSTRFSAPDGASILAESRYSRSSNDDDAQWSYIHLPGV
jgi:hypothetical protein